MAENTIKEPVKGKKEKKNNGKNTPGFFQSLLDGSFLSLDKSPGLLPFALYFTFWAVLLIANTYYAEKKVRRVELYRNEVTELRTIYISNKAELMHLSNQSEIARRLSHLNFQESTVPPRILMEENRRRSFLLRIFNTSK